MHRRFREWSAAGLMLAAASCTQLPLVGASNIPPIPPGEARIWVYRLSQPSAIPEVPDIRFNGTITGAAEMGGAFYRDVPPGRYLVTNTGFGKDVNQSSDVALAAGETAYIKIVQLDNWDENDWEPSFVTFYAWLMPPGTGRVEVQQNRFLGGGNLGLASSH